VHRRLPSGDMPLTADALQSEYEKQRETEIRAKKSIRVSLLPMLLYILFILAAGIYAYTRVAKGMDGLILELRIYSYIVLVVELMGAMNMLFYGCWLFAKPDNTDVFPIRVDKVQTSSMHSCLARCSDMCTPASLPSPLPSTAALLAQGTDGAVAVLVGRGSGDATRLQCAGAHPMLQRVSRNHSANCARR
jgi:hypothetical protein